MNRYQSSSFHPVFGFAAVAMTALTMVLAVGVPAGLAPIGAQTTTLSATPAATMALEVTISPARIDVVGVRDTDVATSPLRDTARTQSRRG